MSSTTALVKELLDQKSTLKGRQSAGMRDGSGAETVSQSEIKRIVKEGVAEALAEHERAYHADETPETTDDEIRTDVDDRSSSGGSTKKGLLLLVLVVALLVRRRRNRGQSSDY